MKRAPWCEGLPSETSITSLKKRKAQGRGWEGGWWWWWGGEGGYRCGRWASDCTDICEGRRSLRAGNDLTFPVGDWPGPTTTPTALCILGHCGRPPRAVDLQQRGRAQTICWSRWQHMRVFGTSLYCLTFNKTNEQTQTFNRDWLYLEPCFKIKTRAAALPFKGKVWRNKWRQFCSLYVLTGPTCATNHFVAQEEVDQTAYLLKSMSIPLSKQVTLDGDWVIAAIPALPKHHMWCIYFVGFWFTVGIRHSLSMYDPIWVLLVYSGTS